MIDVENAVFNTKATNMRTDYLATYPKLTLTTEYTEYPEEFPWIALWQEDNYTHLNTREIGSTDEHYVNAMFHTEIATIGNDRKTVAKKLANSVDALYRGMGFTRIAMLVFPNSGSNMYRITMRHSGLVERPIGDSNSLISLVYR